MVTSQILKFRDLSKTQKSKNRNNETLFSSNSVIIIQYGKNSFLSEVTFTDLTRTFPSMNLNVKRSVINWFFT